MLAGSIDIDERVGTDESVAVGGERGESGLLVFLLREERGLRCQKSARASEVGRARLTANSEIPSEGELAVCF